MKTSKFISLAYSSHWGELYFDQTNKELIYYKDGEATNTRVSLKQISRKQLYYAWIKEMRALYNKFPDHPDARQFEAKRLFYGWE